MSTRTVRANFRYNGVLTDATSAKLSDPTGTYGVKRDDTDAVVVADGTAMTKVSTGTYEYSFTEPASGLSYTAYVEFVYGGQTYYLESDLASTGTVEPSGVLTLTYASLRREIGRFLGYGRDPDAWADGSDAATDVEDILRSGVRRVITPPPLPGERYSHEWSFLRPVATLTTTEPYTTGTVTISSGVVTLTDGTWPSWAAQGTLTVEGGTYAVASRTSDTVIVLSDTSVDEADDSSYSLGRPAYDLPDDFAMVDGPMIYAAGQSILQSPIPRVSEYDLLNELNFTILSGYPRKYAIRPKSIDMTETTKYELLLSPIPDAAYSLYYHYRVAIPALDSENTTPPGGDVHGELYLEACLAAAEQKLHDMAGLHSARFMECLVASVSHDRKVAAPDTMGFVRDRSDLAGIDYDDHFYTQPALTRYHDYPE